MVEIKAEFMGQQHRNILDMLLCFFMYKLYLIDRSIYTTLLHSLYGIIEPVNLQAKHIMSSSTTNTSLPKTEPELSIQSFHQCSSFISMKLSTNNFILWRNQITPLVRSLGVLHHLLSEEKPEEEVKGDTGEKSSNPNYSKWITNDGLLSSWLLGTMKEEVLTMINGDTAYEIWTSIKEQLLPATIEKARSLKNMLMTIKKGSRTLDEYLREFKSICDNLAAIKEPVSDQDKVFQFAYGLGPRYETFHVAMLTKPPYPSFSQFLLALQGHEQIQNV